MPTSIIDIDVNSDSFKEFYALWVKYQEQLGKTPSKWDAINAIIDKGADGIEAATAEIEAQTAALGEQADVRREDEAATEEAAKKKRARAKDEADTKKTQDKADREAKKQALAAEKDALKVAREREKAAAKVLADTKKTVTSLASGAVSLAKWAAFGGALGLVTGAASLWGLGTLAGSVGDARRAATGLGTTTGRMQSFGLNFGRLVSPDQVGRVADAQSSIAKRWIFGALGISSPQDRDPAELAALAAPRARRLFMQGGQTEEYANAIGLTQVYSIEELRRFANTSEKEMKEIADAYRKDAESLKVSDEVNKKWQDLNVQLGRAGLGIKKTFVEGLQPLLPQLERFSGSFANAIGTLLKAAEDQGWVDNAAAGIEKLATYMASPEFLADVKGFVGNVGLMADGILNLLRVLHLIPQDKQTITSVPGQPNVFNSTNDRTGKTQMYVNTPFGPMAVGGAKFVKPYTPAQVQGVADLTNKPSRYDEMFKAAGEKYGIPWKELKLRAAMESSMNPVAGGSGPVVGLMQVNTDAWKQFSRSQMRDPASNIDAGAMIYADALRRAKGDRHLADAIYYGSPGKPESEQYAANGDAVRRALGLGGAQVVAFPQAAKNAAAVAAVKGLTNQGPLVTDAGTKALIAAVSKNKPTTPTTLDIRISNFSGANVQTSTAQAAR